MSSFSKLTYHIIIGAHCWRKTISSFGGSCIMLMLLLSVQTINAQQDDSQLSDSAGIISKVKWSKDGKHLFFTNQEKRFQFDLDELNKTESDANEQADDGLTITRQQRRSRATTLTGRYLGRPGRGRQYTSVVSPDGKWQADHKDWNLVLTHLKSGDETQVTTDGNETINYGTGTWVYGEELDQNKAMWWTPDSKRILYYRFDNTGVEPFHLVGGWTKTNTSLYTEYYPKAGAKNPGASLYVYDLESKESKLIDVGGGSEEYIYNVRATPDGKTMLLNWTDRLQRHLKVLAIDTETGQCRTVVEEKQENWQTNSPRMSYLTDNQRFVWPSEKSGFTHYELRDLDGRLINQITSGDFQVVGFTIDEERNEFRFAAFSSPENPYYMQFHRVDLDGSNHQRLTSLEMHHSNFNMSPDGKWLVARYEEVNTPPCTALYDSKGELVAKLAEADPSSAANHAEMFSFKSADDKFDIYGIMYKPTNFDPQQKYPVINSLYAGPGSIEVRASYVSAPHRSSRNKYITVRVNNRGTGNRGKAFLDATYGKLGDVDIQDHADAIRHLSDRPYFDEKRVGIVGVSFGGYMAAMGVVKHSDVYKAAVVSAGVTDWRNYDTIYTERYMSTPQLNRDGYSNGSVMKHIKKFNGHMLIMHGMMDDNVHPNNAFQLIDALDKAGKSYESRFWPNGGHGMGRGVRQTQQEFFDRVLEAGD